MPVRIGELLLKEKRITAEQLQDALTYQRQNGGKLGANLVKLGYIQDDEITALLSKQYGVPSIALGQFEIDTAVIKLVPAETARKYQIVPLSRSGATLTIAMTDPTNVFAMDDVKFMTGYNVEPVVASETGVFEAIEKYYGGAPVASVTGRGGGSAIQQATTESALDFATKALEEMPTRRRRSRGHGRPRGDQRRGADPAGRGSAGHQAGQRHPDVGHLEGRQRHPHRALREGIPGPLPHRRHPLQHDGAVAQDAGRDHLPHQDSGEAGHRREAPAAGRPHQDPLQRQGRQQGHRLPRLVPADAVRREDRHAPARQGQADARHDASRLRAGVAEEARNADPEALGHGAGDRAHRQRQDQHAVFVDLADQHAPRRTS